MKSSCYALRAGISIYDVVCLAVVFGGVVFYENIRVKQRVSI
jgi:hypothetical protein